MSSSESVLPPELIYMVMSYLSDEEKMRLIRIAPGIFDVLTSDERFIAEFNSREFYVVLMKDSDEYQELYVSEISNDPEYILGEIIRHIFYISKIEIDQKSDGKHIDTFLHCVPPVSFDEARLNTIRDLNDRILEFRTVKRDHFKQYIYGYLSLHQYPDSDYSDDSEIADAYDDLESVLDGFRQKVRDCFEGARLSDLNTITDLVLMALQTYSFHNNRVYRTRTVHLMKVKFDQNMRTRFINQSGVKDYNRSIRP